MQLSQAEAPVPAAKEPVAHKEHDLEEPVAARNAPAAQLLQSGAPEAAAYVPAAHAAQLADAATPVAADALPAGQVLHAVAPDAAW